MKNYDEEETDLNPQQLIFSIFQEDVQRKRVMKGKPLSFSWQRFLAGPRPLCLPRVRWGRILLLSLPLLFDIPDIIEFSHKLTHQICFYTPTRNIATIVAGQ